VCQSLKWEKGGTRVLERVNFFKKQNSWATTFSFQRQKKEEGDKVMFVNVNSNFSSVS
jgi:hypothetical protein